MQVGLGFWPSKIFVERSGDGVIHRSGEGTAIVGEHPRALGLHPRSARDFLDTLVALGLLARQDGQYSNTPATDLYLDKHKPSYLGGILEMANQRLYGYWNHLTERCGPACRRTKTRTAARRCLRRSLRSGAVEIISRGDDRPQPRRETWRSRLSFRGPV